jgi:hypothetical protein
MFVSLNLSDMMFMHKHREHETLSMLAFLEAPHRSVSIENTDLPNFLSTRTGLELRLLYRNTTGMDITGTADIVVREMVSELVDNHMLESWISLTELTAQVNAVEDDLYNGIAYSYARGAKVPAKQEALFEFHCAPLSGDAAIAAAARAPQRRTLQPAAARPAMRASAPAGPAVPKQRMSSVKHDIWLVADRMWTEAGSPKDAKIVLELRKKIMSQLETEKMIKRTSSSNELGNWQKERLA